MLCLRITTKVRQKWKLLILTVLLTLALATIFLHSSVVYRSPKTLLIYNNEFLCASKLPLANDQWSIMLPGHETTHNSIAIVVLSCRQNFMQRNIIRQTYGSYRRLNNVHILAVVFMLGGEDASDATKTDINKLETERVQFDDIVMGDFVDTYRNLSRKAIMAYDWLASSCQEVDLVVKTDDDVMLNIFKLTEDLGKWTPSMIGSFNVWGAVHWSDSIDRNEESIYYVSPEEYSGAVIPKHCGGLGYVTTMGAIQLIADEISRSFLGSVCTQEDVFMTGIVPEKINADRNGTIELIDKTDDWIIYIDGNNADEDAKYIWKLLSQSENEAVNFDEFGKRSGTKIFYLLEHGQMFERRYKRLWYLLEKSFKNEKLTVKIEIN